jgi:Ca2+-binding RTX toxin-like protein
MTIPTTLIVDDSSTGEASALTMALGAIFNDSRSSVFMNGFSNYGSVFGDTYISFKAAKYSSGSQNGEYSGSYYTFGLSQQNIVSGALTKPDLVYDQVNFVNIGDDYNHRYDTVYGGDGYVTLASTLFHELTHAIIVRGPDSPINLASVTVSDHFLMEQVAVFATNAVWNKLTGDPERVGHTGGPIDPNSPHLPTASAPQTSYISTSDSFSFAWLNGNVTFRTEDGRAGLAADPDAAFTVRTYYRNPILEGLSVSNLVTVERDTGASNAPVFSLSYASGMESKTGYIMTQSRVAGGQDAIQATLTVAGLTIFRTSQITGEMSNLLPEYNGTPFSLIGTNQGRTVMVANERYEDGYQEQDGSYQSINAVGPFATNGSLTKNFILDASASKSTALMGGGITLPDLMMSGSGNDFISVGSYIGSQLNEAWGAGGSDILVGKSGNDRLEGGVGNDVLISGGGADRLNGGDGFDLASFMSSGPISIDMNQTVAGVGGSVTGLTMSSIEYVIGSAGADVIKSRGGIVIDGGGGADSFTIMSGDFLMTSSQGSGDSSSQVVNVAAGSLGLKAYDFGTNDLDSLRFMGGVSFNVNTGVMNQSASEGYFSGFERIYGSEEGDSFSGISSGLKVYGMGGEDTFGSTVINPSSADIDGGLGYDTLSWAGMSIASNSNGINISTSTYDTFEFFLGTGGKDTITLDSTHIVDIDLGLGDDTVYANSYQIGRIQLQLGGGNDTLYAGSTRFSVDGGNDVDTVSYASTSSSITVGSSSVTRSTGADTLNFVEKVIGTSAVDTYLGGGIEFDAAGGDDILKVGTLGGIFHGGSGIDAIDFTNATAAVNFILNNTHPNGLQYDSVERVNGSRFDDWLAGTSGADFFFGGLGNDNIEGKGGFDTVIFDVDRATRDGKDIISIARAGDHYDVFSTHDGGITQEIDHLYNIESLTFSDGSSFALNANWINSFYT